MNSLFVTDLALSGRLERAEGHAARKFVEARARCQPEAGAAWLEVAGACVLFDGVQSPATQTFALGISGLPSAEDMGRIEDFFRSRGAPVLHEVSPLANPGMLALLTGRGYRPIELTSVLVQKLERLPASESVAHVREARPDERDLWARTAVAGWRDTAELSAPMLEFMRITGHAKDLRTFFAEIEGHPVASGALAVHDGVALFAGGATIPEWRNRGVQQALLQHRLACAFEGGCDLAMMCALREAHRSAMRNGRASVSLIRASSGRWGCSTPKPTRQ